MDKLALHAMDRLRERTALDPNIVPYLEAEADRVSDRVPPGHYYLPLHDQGQAAGYAAFKTVDTARGPKLVLATVLAPHMKPKGSSLSHLMQQPQLPAMQKAAVLQDEHGSYAPTLGLLGLSLSPTVARWSGVAPESSKYYRAAGPLAAGLVAGVEEGPRHGLYAGAGGAAGATLGYYGGSAGGLVAGALLGAAISLARGENVAEAVLGLGQFGRGMGGLIGRARGMYSGAQFGQELARKQESSEMQKAAATIDQLQAAYRRIAPTRLPRTFSAKYMPSAAPGTVPSAKSLKALIASSPRLQGMRDLGYAFPVAAENMQGRIIMPKGGSAARLQDAERAAVQVGRAVRTNPDAPRVQQRLQEAWGIPPLEFPATTTQLSPAGRRAINVMAGLHEGHERTTPLKKYQEFRGHATPDVLLREHNMLATATGPGADEARRLIQNVRKTLEGDPLRRYIGKRYPGFDFAFGEGARIPKAMRKDFMKGWPAFARRLEYEEGTRDLYDLTKGAEAADEPAYSPKDLRLLEQRFRRLQGYLREHGVLAGTGHQRIVIPKSALTEKDIHHLGFKEVTVAIPESGQDRFESFRHPDNLFHIHSHPEGWTMHEDAHPAATMLATKVTHPWDKVKTYFQGIPHVTTEGVPGLFYYAKNQVSAKTPLAKKVLNEMQASGNNLYDRMQKKWVPSPTYKPAPSVMEELKTAASALRKRIQIKTDASPRFGGDRYRMQLGGKTIGSLSTDAYGNVSSTNLAERFQGMGLGKKLYGEALRRNPAGLSSDPHGTSVEATRVWEGMAKRPGYSVTQNPGFTRNTAAQPGDYAFRVRPRDMDTVNAHGKGVFSAKLPPAAQTKQSAERIAGGLAEGKPDSDFNSREVTKGMQIEREHSPDPEIQKEIAKDHLTESPRYYVELEKMEKALEKQARTGDTVAAFRTSGDGRKRWYVDHKDGKYTCDCPDFRYRHAGKGTHCKHIKQHLDAAEPAMQKAALSLRDVLVTAGIGASTGAITAAPDHRLAGAALGGLAGIPAGVLGAVQIPYGVMAPLYGSAAVGGGAVGALTRLLPDGDKTASALRSRFRLKVKQHTEESNMMQKSAAERLQSLLLQKSAHWSDSLDDVIRGAGRGAVLPAGIGALSGAWASDEDRLQGALRGGAAGALLGAIPGGYGGYTTGKYHQAAEQALGAGRAHRATEGQHPAERFFAKKDLNAALAAQASADKAREIAAFLQMGAATASPTVGYLAGESAKEAGLTDMLIGAGKGA